MLGLMTWFTPVRTLAVVLMAITVSASGGYIAGRIDGEKLANAAHADAARQSRDAWDTQVIIEAQREAETETRNDATVNDLAALADRDGSGAKCGGAGWLRNLNTLR